MCSAVTRASSLAESCPCRPQPLPIGLHLPDLAPVCPGLGGDRRPPQLASSGPGAGALSIRLVPRSERRGLRSGPVWSPRFAPVVCGRPPNTLSSHRLVTSLPRPRLPQYEPSALPGAFYVTFNRFGAPPFASAHARASGLYLFPWQRFLHQRFYQALSLGWFTPYV